MNNQVIKQNEVFFLTDEDGNVSGSAKGILGVFTDDTRFLSQFVVEVENLEMEVLSSRVSKHFVGTIRLANRAVIEHG